MSERTENLKLKTEYGNLYINVFNRKEVIIQTQHVSENEEENQISLTIDNKQYWCDLFLARPNGLWIPRHGERRMLFLDSNRKELIGEEKERIQAIILKIVFEWLDNPENEHFFHEATMDELEHELECAKYTTAMAEYAYIKEKKKLKEIQDALEVEKALG